MPEIRRMGYLLTGLLAITLLSASLWKPAPPAKFVGLSASDIPLIVGSYAGVDIPVDAETKAALPNADIIQRQYTGADNQIVDLTVIGGTGRNDLHDPRSCLVGAGWQIQNDHVETLPGADNIPVRACQIVSGNGAGGDDAQAEDMVYLYVIHRHIVSSASDIRWALLTSDLLQDDTPVYFVRSVIALPQGAESSVDNAAQHRQLVDFTSNLWKVISPVIYQGERP